MVAGYLFWRLIYFEQTLGTLARVFCLIRLMVLRPHTVGQPHSWTDTDAILRGNPTDILAVGLLLLHFYSGHGFVAFSDLGILAGAGNFLFPSEDWLMLQCLFT